MKSFRLISILLLCLCMLLCEIVYAQQEKRMKVDTISIRGTKAFDAKRISRIMLTEESSLFNTFYFNSQTFDEDITAIEIFYHDQGYLDARVNSDVMFANEDSTRVNITININEGSPTKINRIIIQGNEIVSEKELENQIPVKSGHIFRRNELDETRVSIISFYRTKGFIETSVEIEESIDNTAHQANIEITIDERRRFTINSIQIQGLEKTRKHVIDREIGFEPGDTINHSKLLESQRHIYETGLFRSVYVHAAESESDSTKNIIIELEEKDRIRTSVSAGYDTQEKVRGKIEAYTINLLGSGRKLGASGRISVIRRKLSGSFTSPRVFGSKWQMDFNTGWHFYDEPSYDLIKVFGLMSLGRNMGENTLVIMQYRQDFSKAKNINLSTIPGQTRNNISSMEFSIRHDNRNNLFNATKGIYAELTSEFGGNIFDKSYRFVRTIGRLKYFYPVHRYTTIATSLEIGNIKTNHSLLDIPIQERFYSGGGQSIRGFEYNKVGPLDDKGNPVGGKYKLVWNVLEIRRKIYKLFDMVAFYDAGNVWRNIENINISNIRTTAGLGIRFNTNVGVIRIDYGYKFDKNKNESPGKFYFSMGQAF